MGVLVMAAVSALLSWYPLAVGNRWVYECELRTGSAKRPDVYRWTASVSVKEHIRTPEGLVIIRKVELQGNPTPSAGWPWQWPYLYRNGCLYPLYSEAWDSKRQRFTAQFPTYLKQISPEFCFPLRMGAHWMGSDPWPWVVEGAGPARRGPQDIPADAIRIVQRTSAGPRYVWFRKGVGLVASWDWHNGTYTEGFARLKKFYPRAASAQSLGASQP